METHQNKPGIHFLYLHTLLICEMLLLLMDDIRDTPYYKGRFKYQLKCFTEELCKLLDKEHEKLMDAGALNLGFTNMRIEHEQFLKEVVRTYAVDFPILTEIIRLYKEDPVGFLKKVDINVIIVNSEKSIHPELIPYQNINPGIEQTDEK